MIGIFFPQRITLGFDSRLLTPGLVKKIAFAGVKDRSEVEAAKTLELIGGVNVSPKTVERVLHDVGDEYIELRVGPPSRLSKTLVPPAPADAPESVAVFCDGGRMLTRQPGQGQGVHGQKWRETKNANLERLTPKAFDSDPHPDLPECFRDKEHVAKIAESAVLEISPETLDELEEFQAECAPSNPENLATIEAKEPARGEMNTDRDAVVPEDVAAPSSEGPEGGQSLESGELQADEDDWRPKRLHRTCLSSLCSSKEFGLRMSREARRRRFHEAGSKAFIADGLAWNWSIWRDHFRGYEPILDFVHVVEYLFKASKESDETEAESWETYLRWAELCWQGKVAEVIVEISSLLKARGIDPSSKVGKQSPYAKLHTTHRYLSNNTSRMDYARYRKQGMSVTSAPMESLVKQIHLRVKGTEMFWNDGKAGGEGILQLRSAYLSDDGRLKHYLDHRPGHPYVRRTTKVRPSLRVAS